MVTLLVGGSIPLLLALPFLTTCGSEEIPPDRVNVDLSRGACSLLFICEPTVYSSLEACSRDTSVENCEAAAAVALREHEARAPRFSSLSACEEEIGEGGCTQATDSSHGQNTLFIPMLVGFMATHNFISSYTRPVYFDRNGFVRSGRMRLGQLPEEERRKRDEYFSTNHASSGSYFFSGADSSSRTAKPATLQGRRAGFGATSALRGFSSS